MKLKPWSELTKEEKDRYVTVLWKDGHSNQEIGDFLKTTSNAIAGHRHRLKLTGSGRTRAEGPVNPQRFDDLVDLKEMEELEDQGVSALMPPSPHEPANPQKTPVIKETQSSMGEDDSVVTRLGKPLRPAPLPPPAPRPVPAPPPAVALTCPWPLSDSTKLRPHLCGKPVEPGHDLCKEHVAVALGRRR